MKAETHVLTDVASMLQSVNGMGVHIPSPMTSLQKKQDLLSMLIGDELTRMMVWLFPIDHSKRQLFHSGHHHSATPDVSLHPHVDLLQC